MRISCARKQIKSKVSLVYKIHKLNYKLRAQAKKIRNAKECGENKNEKKSKNVQTK